MRLTLAALPLLVLASCAEPVDETDACGASRMQSFVGQPEALIAATTFAGPIRIIHPGDPVTEDYSPQRLNIMVDAAGRITSLTCG